MDDSRLRTILAEELEKVEGLPAEPLARIRDGGTIPPGVQAALRAMKRAVLEDRDPLAS
jgi:hypothetical protein